MIPSTLEEARVLVQDFPGLDDYGTYNRAPEPMRRITAEEFARRIAHWRIIAVEARQPEPLGFRSLRVFWMNAKNGVGIARLYDAPVGEWKTEFWLIGCPHEHMVMCSSPSFPMVHTDKCTDCGYEFTYDSSG